MKRFILTLFIIPFVFACGSTSDGKSGSYFESVRVYVSGDNIEGNVYEADSVDKDSNNDGICDNNSDNYTFTTDEITVNVTSEAIPNLPEDMELADVEIYNITVSFTPNNDNVSYEFIPEEKVYNRRYYIEPNSTTEIPVTIFEKREKEDSSFNLFYSKLDNNTTYEYIVNIGFKAEELIYGGTHSFSSKFPLRYYDLEDDCTE